MTDAAFLPLLRRYLGDHIVAEADGEEPENVYLVDAGSERKLPGGKTLRPLASLYLGRLLIFKGGSWEELVGRLISSVRDMMTAHANEFVRIRAGGVALDGGALLLPSLPEPHLSALVGLLVNRGGRYLGDESVAIDPVLGLVHGLPLPLLVDSSDLGLFPSLGVRPRKIRAEQRERLGARTPRRPVAPTELDGRSASPAPPKWVVFPSFAPGEPTRFEPVGESDGVFRLLQSVLNLHAWGDRALIVMQRVLSTSSVGRLVVGDPNRAADHLVMFAN